MFHLVLFNFRFRVCIFTVLDIFDIPSHYVICVANNTKLTLYISRPTPGIGDDRKMLQYAQSVSGGGGGGGGDCNVVPLNRNLSGFMKPPSVYILCCAVSN